MASAFSTIEAAWFTIRDSYDDLLDGATQPERVKLTADRDGARDAYYLAVGRTFDESDDFVDNTKADLKEATAALKAQLQTMKNRKAALGLVTSVAKLIAALAAMAV